MATKKIVFPEVRIDVAPSRVMLTDIEHAAERAVYGLGVKHGFAATLTALRFGEFDEAIRELGRRMGFFEGAIYTVPITVCYRLEPRLFARGVAEFLRCEMYMRQADVSDAVYDAVLRTFRGCRQDTGSPNSYEVAYFGNIAPRDASEDVRARLNHRLASSSVVIGENNGFRIECGTIPAETLQEAAADAIIDSLGLNTPRGVVEAILRRVPWIEALDKENGHEYP